MTLENKQINKGGNSNNETSLSIYLTSDVYFEQCFLYNIWAKKKYEIYLLKYQP